MLQTKSASCQSRSDSGRIPPTRASSRHTAVSAGIQAAGGDFTHVRKHAAVKFAETPAADNPEGEETEREAVLRKIKKIIGNINEQEQYIRHQEEKQRRNKLLIEHLTSLIDADRMEADVRREECAELETERHKYEQMIHDHRQKVSSSAARFVMAQSLNEDMVKQKQSLEYTRSMARIQEWEMEMNVKTSKKYTEAKKVLDHEQEKNDYLTRRIQWYEKQLEKMVGKVDRRDEINTTTMPVSKLPDISKSSPTIPHTELHVQGLKSDSALKRNPARHKKVHKPRCRGLVKYRQPEYVLLHAKRFCHKYKHEA